MKKFEVGEKSNVRQKMSNKFKIGDRVKLRNVNNYKHFGEEIVKQLDGAILTVTYLSGRSCDYVLCAKPDDKKEWFFHVDDLEPVAASCTSLATGRTSLAASCTSLVESVQENPPADIEFVVESVQENPSDQILKEDEIHWWVVLDKNGNRASSLSHNIASAAATMSRKVEDLLMDGYSFQRVAITITPVFTLKGEYE